ncbi:MAG TPA: hypothetical protein VL359_19655, partial [bacterium]|nr:hypothetical protein [bacterium]
MLEPIATVKLLALVGYTILLWALARSRVTPSLKLHFGLYLLGLGFWQLTSFVLTLPRSASSAVTWYNLQFGAAAMQMAVFVPLARVFLGLRGFRWASAISYVAAGASLVVGGLQLVVYQVVPGSAGYYVPVIGRDMAVLCVVLYAFAAFGVYLLVAGLGRERVKLQRIRISYVLIGALIVQIGSATNFTSLQAYPVDTVCTLINALLVAYAVTRYRLVDTRTVVRRVLSVIGILVLAVAGFILVWFALSLVLRGGPPGVVSPSGLLAFVTIVCLCTAVGWKTIRPAIDRLAGGRTVSYDGVLEEFTRATRSLLDEERLEELFVRTAANAVGATGACLLVADAPEHMFRTGTAVGDWRPDSLDLPLHRSDALVRTLHDRKFPLWHQELHVDPGLARLRPSCEPFFERSGASVAAPLIQEDTVVGILCLGDHLVDGLY